MTEGFSCHLLRSFISSPHFKRFIGSSLALPYQYPGSQNVYMLTKDKKYMYTNTSKQEAHGPYRSPEKPVQNNKRICTKLRLVEIDRIALEKKSFKFRPCIFAIRTYLPLEKGVILHWYKIECPSPKDALCKVWLKFALWFLRRFLDFGDVFCYFVIISPCKRAWSFICRKLNCLPPMLLCAKFCCN